jgi:thymidine phosphorylase
VTAFLTDMSEPLARSAGNALELREAIGMLQGGPCDARLLEVTLALGAEVMVLGGLAAGAPEARTALRQSLANGAAAERFARMVASLGGPPDFLEKPDRHLAVAPVVMEARASRAGFIASINTRALGLAVVALGGGRTDPGQAIDPSVGLDRLAGSGSKISAGDVLARVHAADREAAQIAVGAVHRAFTIADAAGAAPALVERVA